MEKCFTTLQAPKRWAGQGTMGNRNVKLISRGHPLNYETWGKNAVMVEGMAEGGVPEERGCDHVTATTN